MAQIEIQSLKTSTRVQPVGGEQAVVAAGRAAVFDAEAPVPPIIVPPVDPGGSGPFLVAPSDLGTRPTTELAAGTERRQGLMVLGVRDTDVIYLEKLQPLAQLAGREGRRLLVRIGDG